MSVSIRPATAEDLPAIARLVSELQTAPEHHIGYLSIAETEVAEELAGLAGGLEAILVATAGDEVVGMLAGDWDTDPPRVWWYGPFVRDGTDWQATAARLYRAGRAVVPDGVSQEELSPDDRNERAAAFARAHGFKAETASAVFSLPGPLDASPPAHVRRAVADDEADLAALHDALFPGAHLPGSKLLEEALRTVVVDRAGGRLRGYVVTERQAGDEGYVDFVGVDPRDRRRGIGTGLLAGAVRHLREVEGCGEIHLTVRENLTGARALYASLGFTEERVLRPWRIGFSFERAEG